MQSIFNSIIKVSKRSIGNFITIAALLHTFKNEMIKFRVCNPHYVNDALEVELLSKFSW